MVDGAIQAQIETLAEIPNRVEDLIRRGEARKTSGASEGWTPAQIVGHLCDSARILGGRMFRVVYEDNPTLHPFDENEMVQMGAYQYRALPELMATFRLLSEGNVALLRSVSPDAWARTGVHTVLGTVTLRDILDRSVTHETGHVRQLAETLGIA